MERMRRRESGKESEKETFTTCFSKVRTGILEIPVSCETGIFLLLYSRTGRTFSSSSSANISSFLSSLILDSHTRVSLSLLPGSSDGSYFTFSILSVHLIVAEFSGEERERERERRVGAHKFIAGTSFLSFSFPFFF